MAGGAITFGCSLAVEDYWEVPAVARRAEELGFQRVTMGEHLMDGNPPRPTLLNIPAMAAAAAATRAIRIMTGIVIVPLYHPEMLAVMRRLGTEERVNHHGDFFDFDDVTLLLRIYPAFRVRRVPPELTGLVARWRRAPAADTFHRRRRFRSC